MKRHIKIITEIVGTKHINIFSIPQIWNKKNEKKIKPLHKKTENIIKDISNLFRLEKEGTDENMFILEPFLDSKRKRMKSMQLRVLY